MTRKPVDIICISDPTRLKDDGLTPKCRHTPSPAGYCEWHEWAAKKSKTHRQVRCEHCSKLAIWVPKVPRLRIPVGERSKRG